MQAPDFAGKQAVEMLYVRKNANLIFLDLIARLRPEYWCCTLARTTLAFALPQPMSTACPALGGGNAGGMSRRWISGPASPPPLPARCDA